MKEGILKDILFIQYISNDLQQTQIDDKYIKLIMNDRMMKLNVTWKKNLRQNYVASLLNSEHTACLGKKVSSFPKLCLKIYHLYYNPAISWLLLFFFLLQPPAASLCFSSLLPSSHKPLRSSCFSLLPYC